MEAARGSSEPPAWSWTRRVRSEIEEHVRPANASIGPSLSCRTLVAQTMRARTGVSESRSMQSPPGSRRTTAPLRTFDWVALTSSSGGGSATAVGPSGSR